MVDEGTRGIFSYKKILTDDELLSFNEVVNKSKPCYFLYHRGNTVYELCVTSIQKLPAGFGFNVVKNNNPYIYTLFSLSFLPKDNSLTAYFNNYRTPTFLSIINRNDVWVSSQTYEVLKNYRQVTTSVWVDGGNVLNGILRLKDGTICGITHYSSESDKSAFYAQTELINVDENTSCYYLATIKEDGVTVDKYTIANTNKESV